MWEERLVEKLKQNIPLRIRVNGKCAEVQSVLIDNGFMWTSHLNPKGLNHLEAKFLYVNLYENEGIYWDTDERSFLRHSWMEEFSVEGKATEERYIKGEEIHPSIAVEILDEDGVIFLDDDLLKISFEGETLMMDNDGQWKRAIISLCRLMNNISYRAIPDLRSI